MKLLVVDIGNSRCKFVHGDSRHDFPANQRSLSIEELSSGKISVPTDFDRCVLSSVNQSATEPLLKYFDSAGRGNRLTILSGEDSPLEILLEQKAKVGPDRLAAAMGAFALTGSQTIVVDAGTATTVDLVDELGRFCGGTIFPGFQLGLKALSEETDRLPLAEPNFEPPPELLGKDTESAILAGVFWNQIGGIEKIVANLIESYGDSSVVVTGGYGHLVLPASNLTGEFRPSLVLEGLWAFGLSLLTGNPMRVDPT